MKIKSIFKIKILKINVNFKQIYLTDLGGGFEPSTFESACYFISFDHSIILSRSVTGMPTFLM